MFRRGRLVMRGKWRGFFFFEKKIYFLFVQHFLDT